MESDTFFIVYSTYVREVRANEIRVVSSHLRVSDLCVFEVGILSRIRLAISRPYGTYDISSRPEKEKFGVTAILYANLNK